MRWNNSPSGAPAVLCAGTTTTIAAVLWRRKGPALARWSGSTRVRQPATALEWDDVVPGDFAALKWAEGCSSKGHDPTRESGQDIFKNIIGPVGSSRVGSGGLRILTRRVGSGRVGVGDPT